ncbi:MAG TPA: IS481 family transposase, partial [Isosphaeraceae bacterium]|nr:IS481 family transposase [Isosphaeraceae bacterium]
MSTQERLISAKISLLQLSQELGNISKACKKAGIARSSFYEIKKAYEQFGREGLAPKPKRKPKMPNAFAEEMVQKVLDMTRRFPSFSYVRVARQLQLEGIAISGGGVRKVWDRQGLTRKLARYLWLEKESQEGRGIVTEQALKAIRRLKRLGEASEQHVEAEKPGELLSQDLYFVGVIKGVGRIYMQTAVDCSNSHGFGRLCLSKLPIEAVALVHEKVLPFYDALKVPVQAILTDCGREYCGKVDQHPFEVYLGAQGIEHRTTRPASPFTNGFVERFHRTLKDEFFGKVFREKFYTDLVELQKDLDEFLVFYNTQRAHSGYRCEGRTPWQTMEAQLTKASQEVGP